MVALKEGYPRLTPEEYLIWEEQQELKYEYINGEIYGMTGGTVNHGRIGVNLVSLLDTHLRDSRCIVGNSDIKIGIQGSNDYVYPDASVTCDERDRTATEFISHPCLIVEVLSPSTQFYNRVNKFKLYRRSSSLRDYVLVSADDVAIELYHRDELGKWDIINYVAGDLVALESIDLTFPIEHIYRGIVFASS